MSDTENKMDFSALDSQLSAIVNSFKASGLYSSTEGYHAGYCNFKQPEAAAGRSV